MTTKLDGIELKVGQWLRRISGKQHARIIYLNRDANEIAWKWRPTTSKPISRPYASPLDEIGQYFDAISTPAELTAAGVADEERLVEQQSWREGVELWDFEKLDCGLARISVDGRLAGYVKEDGFINKNSADCADYKKNITNDPKRQIYWTLDQLRDFVQSHRQRNPAVAKLREPETKKLACGLTVRVGDFIKTWKYTYQVKGLNPFELREWSKSGWMSYCTGSENCEWSHVDAAELAASTIRLEDILDETLRDEVRRIRNPIPSEPTCAPCICAGWDTDLKNIAINGHHPECPNRNHSEFPNGSMPASWREHERIRAEVAKMRDGSRHAPPAPEPPPIDLILSGANPIPVQPPSPKPAPSVGEKLNEPFDEIKLLREAMCKLHKAAKNTRALLRFMFDVSGSCNAKEQGNLIELTEAIEHAERTRDTITIRRGRESLTLSDDAGDKR